MSKATLKKQYNKAIDLIDDDEFLKAVYALLKIKSDESETLMTEFQKTELDRSIAKRKAGKSKQYTITEAKRHTYSRLKK